MSRYMTFVWDTIKYDWLEITLPKPRCMTNQLLLRYRLERLVRDDERRLIWESIYDDRVRLSHESLNCPYPKSL